MKLVTRNQDLVVSLEPIEKREDGGEVVDAKSIMQLLMLAGTRGTRLKVMAEGKDAKTALKAIGDLVESGFDDE